MALSETATIRVNAEDAQARAMFQAIGDGFDRLERKTEKVAKQQRTMAGELQNTLQRWTGVAAVIGLATEAVRHHQDEVRRSAQAYEQAEEAAMRFAIQANAFDLSDKQIFARIAGIGGSKGVGVQEAHAAATQLVSSGFSRESVLQGGALGAFLEALQATNQSGKGADPAALAKAMAKWLDARGAPLTAEGITQAAVPISNLFASTDVQLSDLTSLSGEAAGMLTAGMSTEDILGAFQRMLKISKSPEAAATALGRITTKLATAGENTQAMATLTRLGLTPGAVNPAGNRFPDILDALGTAIEGVPQSERLGVLTGLVGEERAPGLAGLIANRGDIRSRSRSLGDDTNYRRAIQRFQQSSLAGRNALASGVAVSQFDQGRIAAENQQAIDYYVDVELRKTDSFMGRFVARYMQQFGAALAPEVFNARLQGRGLDPASLREKVEVELVAPTGQRTPGTMQQKSLQNGF